MKPNYWKIRVVQNKTNISEPLVKSPFSLSRIPTPHSKTPLQVRTKHLFGVQSFISLENLLVQDQTYPITDLHCLKSTGTSENDFQLPRPVNTGEIEITPKGADPGNDFSNRSRSRSRSRSTKGNGSKIKNRKTTRPNPDLLKPSQKHSISGMKTRMKVALNTISTTRKMNPFKKLWGYPSVITERSKKLSHQWSGWPQSPRIRGNKARKNQNIARHSPGSNWV